MVRFSFIEDDEYTVSEYLDIAKKLTDIGVKIDIGKLKDITKLPFIAADEEWTPEQGGDKTI